VWAVSEREASCSCGQLRLVVSGEPIRVSICHCLACQRRTGSSYGYQARFARERVRVLGESTEYIRRADEDGAERRSYFCSRCGSTVYYTGHENPDMIAVAVGAFADPKFPAPSFSVWEERMHSWVVPPEAAEHIY
jgi:hypothetical protein